jgi:branched-subunit amino acid aminotransferase/4-amino-4-deoxychorismate lyase
LAHSCRALQVPFPGALDVPAGIADGIVRYQISDAGVSSSLRDPTESPHRPLSLILSGVVHRPYPHKTTDRGRFDDARARARVAGADDAILLTLEGRVAECAIWTVFWWEGEQLATPALELGILPGVARVRLGQLVPIEERKVEPAALAGRSLFVANAARGVVSVATLEGRPVPDDGRTAELVARFWD